MSSTTPPAGWYPNPENSVQTRYWDGSSWSDLTRSAETSPASSPSSGASPARDAKRQAKNQDRAAKADEQQRQAYLRSPVGLAEAAAQRGDRFFQTEIPHSVLSGYSSDFFLAPTWDTTKTERVGGAPDVLGKIEEFGWRLEHVSWLFIETGSSSREKLLSSGDRTTVSGRVDGIYLFRAVKISDA